MKKKSIKYIVLAIFAIAVAVYLVMSYSKPQEKVVARIDMTTALVDADKPQFEIYVDGSETASNQVAWMPKFNMQGYVVQREANKVDIIVKSLADSDIKVVLRGPDKRDDNNEFVPVWVDYTSLNVNGEEMLKETTSVWHNKPFEYIINVKNGQEYKIQAKWKAHKDK